ncbi:hypothetical protein RCS94_09810 [Orbaceae bacterium ac157xtp]
MISPSSYGALSATSANIIKGNAPGFRSTSGKHKLGFKIGNVSYSENLGNIREGTAKEFDPSLKLSDFRVIQLSANDFNVSTDYEDSDGDAPHPTTPFTMGSVSAQWWDGNDNYISDTSKAIGCGSSFTMPLKLKLSLRYVQVHSKYGNPKDSGSTTLTKTYLIKPKQGICYVTPNSSIVYSDWTWINIVRTDRVGNWVWNLGTPTSPDSANGGGYSSDFYTVLNPSYGDTRGGSFKASASTKFPTTGFPGAKFKLEMTGSTSDYTFSVSAYPSSSVSVDSNGFVTLNSKPSGSVTVRARSRYDSSVFEYTFNPTRVWLVPLTTGRATYEQAVSLCGGESYLPTRAELTNSPRKTAPERWNYVWNAATRSITGSLVGEWGFLSQDTYPSSNWKGNGGYYPYWTKEPWVTGGRANYFVDVRYGFVSYSDWGPSGDYVACRR